MEERLSPRWERGLNRNTLQLFGLMFMVLGTLGSAIQLRYLNAAAAADGELLATAESMNAATMAIVFLAVQAMAVPIFAVLTLDGFQKTASVKNTCCGCWYWQLSAKCPTIWHGRGSFGSGHPTIRCLDWLLRW